MGPYRDGWIIQHELRPSLNKHFMPTGQGHQTKWDCWCKPTMQGVTDVAPCGTLVTHKDENA